MWMQQVAGATTGGDAVLESLRVVLALVGVCVLALVVLRWLASRGVGRAGRPGARVQVVERVGLDAQRALYLVQVEGRVLLIGTGPGAAPALIAELSGAHSAEQAGHG
jgi:flagellar biogenesis protein FliO